MTIDAVLLDVGGVFVLPDPVALAAVLAPLAPGLSPSALARSHYAGVAAMDVAARANGGTPGWPDYQRAMARSLGIEREEEAITLLANAFSTVPWSSPIPGAVGALKALAGTGVRIAIVSNSDGSVENQLRASGVCQVGEGDGVRVVAILDSAVVGYEKPHPAIFERALEVLEAAPDEAVHVGDTGWADIVGAEGVGIRAVHMDPYRSCLEPDGHDHVVDLAGVVDLVLASR